ncbi:hypothetical protein [Streptomyces sp. RFCAC02]|uniref:hypothetical protein n=1 Tax=Streptomyces sp. RFCAC02 TaxID=2499143 RepID=UPI00101F7770|nr:hypothetical protein [Streptomyces sp. RFCAC02]
MPQVIDYGRFADRLREARERTAADPGQRWALLDEVQREWGWVDPGGEPVWRAGDGENVDIRPDPSLPVPAALTEWWASPVNSFSFSPRLYWVHTQWPPLPQDELPPGTVPPAPGTDRRVCVFMSEYQYCNQWGYPAAEAAQDDPRVLVSTGDDEWVPQAASISEFLLHLALERLPGHFGFTVRLDHGDLHDDPAVVERLHASFPELGLLPWQELAADAVLHGGPDVLVTHARGGWVDWPLIVHGRTRQAVEDALAVLCPDLDGVRVEPPDELPDRLLDLPPLEFAAGDEDDLGRWRAESVGTPPPGGVPRVPAAAGLDGLPDVTARAAGGGGTVAVAGDAAGTVHARLLGGAAGDEWLGTSEPLHRAPVTAVTCVRQGAEAGSELVVSGDAAGVLRIWRTDGPPAAGPFDRRGAAVTALAATVLPGSGTALAAAWADGLVRLWDLGTGCRDVVADLPLGTGIEDLHLTADGVLWVRGGTPGWAALRLDPDELWVLRWIKETADRFPWDRLRCNRGTAENVPSEILRAGWDDETVATRAAEQLHSLLVHGYGATAAMAAAPLLLKMVANSWTPIPGRLMQLVADMARVDRGRSEAADTQLDTLRQLLPAARFLAEYPDEEVRTALAELEQNLA